VVTVNTKSTTNSNNRLDIFDTRFHNPSIFSIREKTAFEGPVIDYCVPANTYFPPPEMMDLIKDNLPDILKYYPDYAPAHQNNIALLTGTPSENVVAANGVTEIITIMCREALSPILTSVPTFGRWTDLPQEFGVPICYLERRPETQFKLTVAQVVDRVREVRAKTLVISNPNNPTGAWLSFNEMRTLLDALRDLPLIIIDESFIDFSGIESAELLAIDSTNTVVVKSMGKAIGWHGVRLGYAVANTQLAQQLRAKVPYWNINGLAAFVLKHAINFKSEYYASFKKIAEDRDYMFNQFRTIPQLITYPSKANFLFSKLPDGISGKAIRNTLLEEYGLFVRECSNKIGSSENYLRCVVKKPSDSDSLTRSLTDIFSSI